MSNTTKKAEANQRQGTWGKRMKPYTPKGARGKERADFSNTANPHGDGTPGFKLGVSKLAKVIAKNAERAKKKAVRRIAKEDIIDELNTEHGS